MSVIKHSKIESFEKKEAFLKISIQDRIAIKNNLLQNGIDNTNINVSTDLLTVLDKKEIDQLALEEEFILTITENGYGKRTSIYEYRTTNRGGIGITNIITSKRNGDVIFSNQASDDQDVIMMTDKGIIIRTKVKEIRISGRNTQGVTLMKTNDKIISVAIAKSSDDEISDDDSENVVNNIVEQDNNG
jgi:DNA gyrase subunit A